MTLPRSTVIAALVTGSLAMGFGTAHAEPAAPAPKETVNYAVQLVEKTVVATLGGGTFSIVEKEQEPVAQEGAVPEAEPVAEAAKTQVLEIKDKAGDLVGSMPLEFTANGVAIPVKSEVKNDGTVVEITPEKPAGLVTDQPLAVKPIASLKENQQAQNEFASNFGIATAIGGFVGTAIGAVIGCVVTIVAGCVPGLITGAGVGGILGTIAVGGPTLVAAGIELINTLQAPAGTTKWANDGNPVVVEGAEPPK
ncbi:hypothetical protein NLM24_07505 [Nocardia zapadnayensis]|uniref:hypothetical protein n=1 Tax=Nocardia rhamnosiphila TaxID=426716 RepID=UPI0022485939|nr:hypothetical protein [Nocardia zapadnayensis]MCX0270551.1 hypothetical protein [Nocardia zapadnayensis]